LSPTSVGHVHRLLHKVLADGLRKGLVVRNVAAAATPPKQIQPGQRQHDVWTPEQLRTFLASVADDRLVALWRLLIMSGCRRGEAVGAHWADIDLDAGTWSIRRSRSVVNGSPVMGTPKNGKRRPVALDAGTIAALRAHRARQAAERLLWGQAYQDSGFVFTHEDGTPLHPNPITRRFVQLSEGAKLPRIRLTTSDTAPSQPCSLAEYRSWSSRSAPGTPRRRSHRTSTATCSKGWVGTQQPASPKPIDG
jgi:integrase